MAGLARTAGQPVVSESGADEKRVSDLEAKLDKHIQDYNDFKDQVINMLKQLQDQLNEKADFN